MDNFAYADSSVNVVLENLRKEGHKGFLVHVMPQHYMMQGLFVTPANSNMGPGRKRSWCGVLGFVFPFLSSHSHQDMMGAVANEPLRLVFSQLTWPDGEYASKVDVDQEGWEVLTVQQTSPRNYWGQMPMPAY